MRLFTVSFDWEVADGVSLRLIVTGTREPVIPAVRSGHPDNWTPQEGGEIEIERIRSGHPLTQAQVDKLLADDEFLKAVEAAL